MGGFEYATRPYFISFVNLLGCVTQRTPSTDGLRPSFEGRTIISSLYSAPKRYYLSIPLVSIHNNRKNEAFLLFKKKRMKRFLVILSLTTMLGSNGPNLCIRVSSVFRHGPKPDSKMNWNTKHFHGPPLSRTYTS